jgi:hypothetical protein
MLPDRLWFPASWLAVWLLAAPPLSAQTTGLVPINDLGSGTYRGFQGGLYSGGLNAPPAGHLAAAISEAGGIVPRNAAGAPDPSGWIAMIAVGMSNTTHEFGAFERNADADSTRNARVVLLDTAFGGQTATAIANPSAPYWTTMAQRLSAMGLTPAQVQVAWLKEAEANPANDFPVHAQALRDTLRHVVQILRTRFPNLRLCYLSSRIYGGYAPQGSLNPEPQAYESGFAVKWLIEQQIGGDTELSYGQLPGAPRAPLMLWGPYLWADGTNPRSDGLTWPIGDLEGDHVHPSPSGEQKVATLLAHFFAGDPTAAPWWPSSGGERLMAIDAEDDATVSAGAPTTNFGADPVLVAQGGAAPQQIFARFDLAAIPQSVLLAKLSLRVTSSGIGGGTARRVDDTSWDENTITWSNAPASGPTIVTCPQASRDGTFGANVTDVVRADVDRKIAFAVVTTSAGAATYHSAEGGQPPRLVLVTSAAPASVASGALRPASLRLLGANPSARGVRLEFGLPSEQRVDVALFAVDGRRIRSLASGLWSAGSHEARWDGRDAAGRDASPGLYFATLRTRDSAVSIKVVRTR